jgi:hypothetical protein
MFSALNAAEARYLLVGAYAAMLYTEPRWTKDLDIWIEPSNENARRVRAALADFGAPAQVTEEELARPGLIVQIGLPPNRIDIITTAEGVQFADAWARRQAFSFGTVPIPVLHLDDLITNKRAVGRPQDLIDVASLEKARARRI